MDGMDKPSLLTFHKGMDGDEKEGWKTSTPGRYPFFFFFFFSIRRLFFQSRFFWRFFANSIAIRSTPTYGVPQNAGILLKKLNINVYLIHGLFDLFHPLEVTKKL